MTTLAPMTSLLPLPPPPAPQIPLANRAARVSTRIDSIHLSDDFWDAVKFDSPPTASAPTFDSPLLGSPIDEKHEKTQAVVSVKESTTKFHDEDDPIIAFETLDCYSPNRPTFSPAPPYDYGYGYDELDLLEHGAHGLALATQPCPFGETSALGLYTNPAPTLGSIRDHETVIKPPSRQASPWSAILSKARSNRFHKPSQSTSYASLETRHQPAIAVLAAAFLDSIAKLTRSRSSTPSERTSVMTLSSTLAKNGKVQILDSEVLINVLEDGKRAGVCEGQSLCSEFDKALERLHLRAMSEGDEERRGRSPGL